MPQGLALFASPWQRFCCKLLPEVNNPALWQAMHDFNLVILTFLAPHLTHFRIYFLAVTIGAHFLTSGKKGGINGLQMLTISQVKDFKAAMDNRHKTASITIQHGTQK